MIDYDIVFASDTHIDINNNPNDQIDAFNQIAELTKKAKLLILGGDILDKRRPHPKELNIFRDFVKSVSCDIICIIGNHDKNLDASTLDEFIKFNIKGISVHEPPYTFEYNNRKIYLDHILVENSKMGEEDFTLSKRKTVSIDSLLKLNCDFYLIGDVHKGQVLHENPLICYPGSIYRTDFGERNEDKFVVLINSTTTEYKYHKLNSRPMIQFDLVYPFDFSSIRDIENAQVKVSLEGTKEEVKSVDETSLKNLLKQAYSFSICYNVKKEKKIRNKNLTENITDKDCFLKYAQAKNFTAQEQEEGLKIINTIKEP